MNEDKNCTESKLWTKQVKKKTNTIDQSRRNVAKYERKTKLMRFISLLISIAQYTVSWWWWWCWAGAGGFFTCFTSAYDFVLMNFFFRFLYRFSYMFTFTKQTKSNQCKKKFGIFTLGVSHTYAYIAIEMRCKQSDIFAKFMYLRHW